MKPTFSTLICVICFFITSLTYAQTCSGTTFPGISQPANCTYTYTSSGWTGPFGLPFAPTSNSSGQSICILADYTGNLSFNIRGTLYIASGVKFSGSINGFTSSSTVLVNGELNITNTPSLAGLDLIIGSTGIVSFPGDFDPGGDATTHNAGTLNIGGDLDLGGQTSITNYTDAKIIAQGNSTINAPFNNCGVFELFGSLNSGGSSGLNNQCSVYIHTDMNLNADYINEGLIILDGNLGFGSATFYNNGILVVDNINLNNDSLIGNDDDSLLIVRNTASLSGGAVISGHLYYDMDDGGGFDSVCGTCTEGIDIVTSIVLPSTNEEILANCGEDIIVNPIILESKLDFDGVDDYLSTPQFINGFNQVSIMAWVNSDTGNSTNMAIAGEDVGCRLWLQNGNIPRFSIKGTLFSEKTISANSAIKLNEWHHLAGTYNSDSGLMQLYVDGVRVGATNVGATGVVIANTASSNGNFEIGRRSSTITNKEYFKGDIDEVRVFDAALTEDQIQRMIYQEIRNNSGNVKGEIIDKNIIDISSNATISWSNLLAYYPMSNIISNTRTKDFSSFKRITKLHNITSFQEETAPLPYTTKSDGDWAQENSWLHGYVWDIESVRDNKDWSIVKIQNNITTTNSHKTLGLIIDSGKKLTVNGDNLVSNSWYLKLDGTLDLKNDSQLIQTDKSDLVTSAAGKILRRQEGTTSVYWYNYWSSPVGSQSVTAISNNNGASNNPNNTTFKVNLLKEGNNSGVQFTSAYNEVGKISTQWLYTYKNGLNYYHWAYVAPTTKIEPGVGYTQKGIGKPGPSQQYIFEGKPNNGTILVPVTDAGGSGSVPSVSKTDYLLGNPYASALDIHKFIDDNIGVIDGTLHLWQQWSGSSHNLDEYNGGYAQVNKTGSVKAYQFVGLEGATNGSQDGTITPSRYLPVGQGFMTEIIANGHVEFNNNQRIFIKEADADGTYNNGSAFFRTAQHQSESRSTDATETEFQKIRMEFSSVNGPATNRELLLGFSNLTTDAFDYGYDAKNTDENANDLSLGLDGEKMIIQAYAPITNEKVIPLIFKASGSFNYEIKISELENIDENQAIYLRDHYTGQYFDLTSGEAYNFSTEAGEYKSRLEIVFQTEEEALSVDESEYTYNLIYFNNQQDKLFVKGLNNSVEKLKIINMLGQTVNEFKNVTTQTLENGLSISGLASGTYVVYFNIDNKTKTKKIIVN